MVRPCQAARDCVMAEMPPPNQTIVMASDHAGYGLKEALKPVLEGMGLAIIDVGCDSTASVDYPDYANRLAAVMAEGRADRGVVVCGSGIGISIAANRHPHVRAALCHDPLSAQLSRRHNNANVLALGARLIGPDMATACLAAFLDTPFEGGRHERRVEKLSTVPVLSS